jgi:DNA-binding CsgD family transcriptional regulator
MTVFTNRKNKVVLSDYNYRRDIENRILMAELTVLEVEVLREIVDGSLKTTLDSLSIDLNIDKKELTSILKKLSPSKLFRLDNEALIIDKEMRKYYESQIIKFDDDFEPGMEFIQGLLSKVPIHILPQWYSITRIMDNIFFSITQKYLLTPKIYENYLQDLQFDEPYINKILQDVHKAPDFKVSSRELMQKYSLSREEFEECMLYLEYNFCCCLSYNRVGNTWEEVVTPFHEWREYLKHLHKNTPEPIKDVKSIQPVSAKYDQPKNFKEIYFDRDVLEVEKSIKRLGKGWFLIEDFQKGFSGAIGNNEAVILKNKGKRWKYHFPEYNDMDLAFIEWIIHDHFTKHGHVEVGFYKNKPCFSVTEYGRTHLH